MRIKMSLDLAKCSLDRIAPIETHWLERNHFGKKICHVENPVSEPWKFDNLFLFEKFYEIEFINIP
jgi:hypothetical protein